MEYMQHMNFIIVSILLTILSLTLNNWQPPIQKKQYIVIALLIAGALLGWNMLDSWAYGICLSGLVYYKDKLVEEMKLVAGSYGELRGNSKK